MKKLMLMATLLFAITCQAENNSKNQLIKTSAFGNRRFISELLLKKNAVSLQQDFMYRPISFCQKQINNIKIKKENNDPDLKQYGGIMAIGFAFGGGGVFDGTPLGGGGTFGVPLKFYPDRKFSLEAGIFISPNFRSFNKQTYDRNGNYTGSKKTVALQYPIAVGGGMNIYLLERYKPNREKIVKNGIFFKGSTVINMDYNESTVGFGWARERYREKWKKYAYDTELGICVIFFNYESNFLEDFVDDANFTPIVYFRFNWNWFLF